VGIRIFVGNATFYQTMLYSKHGLFCVRAGMAIALGAASRFGCRRGCKDSAFHDVPANEAVSLNASRTTKAEF
jgi:hypothetical protein